MPGLQAMAGIDDSSTGPIIAHVAQHMHMLCNQIMEAACHCAQLFIRVVHTPTHGQHSS